jgi:hypothetical protein
MELAPSDAVNSCGLHADLTMSQSSHEVIVPEDFVANFGP